MQQKKKSAIIKIILKSKSTYSNPLISLVYAFDKRFKFKIWHFEARHLLVSDRIWLIVLWQYLSLMSLTFSQALARGYLARDFIFFGVWTKFLAHIGAKKFEFMGKLCLKSLIEHYLKKESFKMCFFPFEITQLKKKINK